jgi:hypothetical protein
LHFSTSGEKIVVLKVPPQIEIMEVRSARLPLKTALHRLYYLCPSLFSSSMEAFFTASAEALEDKEK